MPIPALVQPYIAGLHRTKHCTRSWKILYCRPKVVPLLLNLRVVIKADSDTGKLEQVLFQMLQLIPHAPLFHQWADTQLLYTSCIRSNMEYAAEHWNHIKMTCRELTFRNYVSLY